MNFRLACAADAGAIATLHAESWRIAYRGILADTYLDGDLVAERKTLWEQRFRNPASNQYVVVAEDAGRIVGFACAYGNADEQCGTLLENLHVDPACKGCGIGSQLMGNVARWSASAWPGIGMHLFVVESNLSARRFYERLGGVVNGDEIWSAPDGSSVKALRYAWPSLPPELLSEFRS